jgi:DNA-binding response OmpR family regulator
MTSSSSPRILLVEDEVQTATAVSESLEQEGFQVSWSPNGSSGLRLLASNAFDAVILDWMVPELSGLDLLKKLRKEGKKVPVLLLTARDAVEDRIRGLDTGADDYLVKPFALEELVARLEAQLRRPGHLLGSSLRIANLEFDTRNRQASIDDQPQVLSARETAVLELLMRSKGRVVSKKQVEDHIFGHSGEVASNAIEVYVHRLRKQLSERGAKVQVHTIRGVGYLIAEEK